MSALARWFKHQEYAVFGYDRTPSELTDNLSKEGIEIHYEDAIEAIPEDQNGSVVVKEKRNAHKVTISIADSGLGIPKAMLVNIFTPNFTTKTSGTGLGLAICKGIVEQSRGSIWFDTEEGRGTTFYVELPLHENGTVS